MSRVSSSASSAAWASTRSARAVRSSPRSAPEVPDQGPHDGQMQVEAQVGQKGLNEANDRLHRQAVPLFGAGNGQVGRGADVLGVEPVGHRLCSPLDEVEHAPTGRDDDHGPPSPQVGVGLIDQK